MVPWWIWRKRVCEVLILDIQRTLLLSDCLVIIMCITCYYNGYCKHLVIAWSCWQISCWHWLEDPSHLIPSVECLSRKQHLPCLIPVSETLVWLEQVQVMSTLPSTNLKDVTTPNYSPTLQLAITWVYTALPAVTCFNTLLWNCACA